MYFYYLFRVISAVIRIIIKCVNQGLCRRRALQKFARAARVPGSGACCLSQLGRLASFRPTPFDARALPLASQAAAVVLQPPPLPAGATHLITAFPGFIRHSYITIVNLSRRARHQIVVSINNNYLSKNWQKITYPFTSYQYSQEHNSKNSIYHTTFQDETCLQLKTCCEI